MATGGIVIYYLPLMQFIPSADDNRIYNRISYYGPHSICISKGYNSEHTKYIRFTVSVLVLYVT